jgi:hypothetical protein
MAVFANISIDQGSDFSSTITVEGGDGLVVNLEGYSARGQIRKTYTSLTAVDFEAAVQSEESGHNFNFINKRTDADNEAWSLRL